MLTQFNQFNSTLTTPIHTLPTTLVCPKDFLSVCYPGLGDRYVNKRSYRVKSGELGLAEANRIREDLIITAKLQRSNVEEVTFRQSIFEEYLKTSPFPLPTVWEDFLLDLINVGIKSRLAEEEKGNCMEDAYLSILESILYQLGTGERETIYMVSLSSEDDEGEGGHTFALYNAKIAKSLGKYSDPQIKFSNKNEFVTFFRELKQNHPNRPITTCDSWVGFHGEASNWLSHFIKSKGNFLSKVTWTEALLFDFSIPPFRSKNNAFNAEQRAWLKSLCFRILRGDIREDFGNWVEENLPAQKNQRNYAIRTKPF